MLVPRANELTKVDGCQARLETLLEGTDERAKSDRLLRVAGDGLGPDANARAMLRVEIRSTASRLFCRDAMAQMRMPPEGGRFDGGSGSFGCGGRI